MSTNWCWKPFGVRAYLLVIGFTHNCDETSLLKYNNSTKVLHIDAAQETKNRKLEPQITTCLPKNIYWTATAKWKMFVCCLCMYVWVCVWILGWPGRYLLADAMMIHVNVNASVKVIRLRVLGKRWCAMKLGSASSASTATASTASTSPPAPPSSPSTIAHAHEICSQQQQKQLLTITIIQNNNML